MGSILRAAESRLSGSGEKRHGRRTQYIFNVEQRDNLTLPLKDDPGRNVFNTFKMSGFSINSIR